MKQDDFLVEILTEELPPKSLLQLAQAFRHEVLGRVGKSTLVFDSIQFFATPRRLALLIKQLDFKQSDREVERRGPAVKVAFDEEGNPSKACLGFAKSCGVSPDELITIKTAQGEWVGVKQIVRGKTVFELLPDIIHQALINLPIPKRMGWAEGNTHFVRPVQSVAMLYGDAIVKADILGCKADRLTYGHRFLAPQPLPIPHASTYTSLLATAGFVLADFHARREKIECDAQAFIAEKLGSSARALVDDALLNEVTGLVEWPVALSGQFDTAFLLLPQEVLISAMEEHQRYFPVIDDNNALLPHFVIISNIESLRPERVVKGNERVLKARLADAAFFYESDKKESLATRLERLKGVVFQANLGTLYDKATRLAKLAAYIAKKMQIDADEAARAGWLAKTDLTTDMVNEFPQLQGVMGSYYALYDGETKSLALALREQYQPRFAGDLLPTSSLGQALAAADRIDSLTGIFANEQAPTGDKDPFGLRRAAAGILRILIEREINLDLQDTLAFAISCYQQSFDSKHLIEQLLVFMQERMRTLCQEQNISADVFAAVAALQITNPLDMYKRVLAVQRFKKMQAAETLSIANKRVSNILAQYTDAITAKKINPTFFEEIAEMELAKQLELKSKSVSKLYQSGKYEEILMELTELREPIDIFFDKVMVMTDDKNRRENRLLLLSQLRALFLQVADIALLQ